MDEDDLRAALDLLVTEEWRHFNVYCLLAVAREIGLQRRKFRQVASPLN